MGPPKRRPGRCEPTTRPKPTMFQRRQRPGWMAVDLQPAGVRMAHVVRMPTGRPRLGLLQHAVRAGSDVDDLLALRRAIGLQRYRCTTSADRGSYQIVQTSAPA